MPTIQCPVCEKQIASDEQSWNKHLRAHGVERVSAQVVFRGKSYEYDKLVFTREAGDERGSYSL